MALWGIEVKPGKPYAHSHDEDKGRLRITQATLGNGVEKSIKSSSQKTVLQFKSGENSTVYLCSLFTNTSETCHLDLEIEKPDEEIEFSVIGERSIHLSGFYIYSKGDFHGSDDEFGEDIAETDSESEDSEFATLADEDQDSYDSDFIDDGDVNMFDSSPRKSGVVIEEIVDDEEPSEEDEKKEKLAMVEKNDDSALVVSEDEDGFPISETKKSEEKNDEEDGKKRKNDESTLETNGVAKKKKKLEKKKNKKGKKVNVSEIEESEKSEEENNDVPVEREAVPEEENNDVPVEGEAVPAEEKKEGKKKKKKKNKKAEKDSSEKEGKDEKEKDEEKPAQKTRTFANGLIIEEISMGRPDGKRASPGNKVSVNYIGKLKSGKVFDSNVGQRPFKFRLGIGQVIKGWDVGVNGMRVGDKRRLTVPPSMGYGDQKVGMIPKGSWLIFDVELVDVN